MNYRKGGLRVLIAVTILWAAAWGWRYHVASAEAGAWARIHAEEARKLGELRGGPDDTPENRHYFNGRLLEASDLQREQIARRDTAAKAGLGGLGILGILLLVGASVWRDPKRP